jgi:DNA-directed RNA polymerase subunit RPC12/RpoP
MPRGYKCPNPACQRMMAFERGTGVVKCRNCGSIAWWLFDAPQKGGSGRGQRCNNCGRLTFHKVGSVGLAQPEAHVYRCSTCNATCVVSAS